MFNVTERWHFHISTQEETIEKIANPKQERGLISELLGGSCVCTVLVFYSSTRSIKYTE
jgi:hypothetical protein